MRLFYNARIYTQDSSLSLASAIAIDRELIIATGQTDELLSQFPYAKKQDMGGRLILPGLTDAHLHLKNYAFGLQKIDCEAATLEECVRRVAERAKKAKPGEWVLGHGWNQNIWAAKSLQREGPGVRGWPHGSDLDKVAPNNPVYLTAKSLHAAWANTAALKLAGINANTPDPKDGQIQRDTNGQATGILLELPAMGMVEDKLPEPTIDEIAQAIQKAQPILWKLGLTGIHDFDRRDSFMALQQLHAQDKLKLRVLKNLPVELLDQAVALGLRSGFGDDWLRIGSIKAFMDGALGPHTAAMFQPYIGEDENRGILNLDGEELFDLGRRAADVGLSMTVHAIGDRANHEVLDAYEQLRSYERDRHLPRLRHRIEHVQVLHADDAARLGKMNIIASMQPIHATSDMLMADRYWGKRSRLAYAWRTQLEHGARLAFGSDAPVESPNPFWGLHAAVTRRRADGSPSVDGWYPEQKLSLAEALAGYTHGPAYAAGMEDRSGKLAPGFLADLTVVEKDLFSCHADDLLTIQSSATMVGGEWVWQA